MIRRLLLISLLVAALAGFTACSDDNGDFQPVNGNISTDVSGNRITILHLGDRTGTDTREHSGLEFVLENPAAKRRLTFSGGIVHNPQLQVQGSRYAYTCSIAIGETDIPDGDYYLSVTGDGLPDIRMRRVAFKDNVGSEYTAAQMTYDDLQGSGTADDPYLINDDGDFLTLLWYLEEDPDHAYGRYFRQTESFDLPRRSMIIDGHIWAPVTFSGTYDGGGHELRSLIYQGASDPTADSGVGLFKELYSATVKNLTMSSAMIINAAGNTGIIAGSARGQNTFENITLQGTVTASGPGVGGLVGSSDGDLIMKKIRISSLAVSCTEASGNGTALLAGSHCTGMLKVDGVSTPDHIFSVTGGECVGGIVGKCVTDGPVTLSNITLEHSVDTESSSVKVIYGTKYVGGLAGFLEPEGRSTISGINIKAPVRGTQDVGALAGHAFVSNLTVSSAVLSSVVNGSISVGGFFGYAGFRHNGAVLVFNGSDRSSRYVVKSSADAEVKGDQYVGGLIGYFDSNYGKADLQAKVEIAVNVHGKTDVGGAIGYASHLDAFNPYRIDFTSATMRVEATDQNAGGVFGRVESGFIDGGKRFNLKSSIPAAKDIESCFSGVVRASRNAGGVAGSIAGVIEGVSSSAAVTSTEGDAAGVVANLNATAYNCAFTGTVTSKSKAGGIIAVCAGKCSVSDCVNLGTIQGTGYTGGVCGQAGTGGDEYLHIERCYNGGAVTGGGPAGIVAYFGTQSTYTTNVYRISECGNSGEISGTGGSSFSVGGIVGHFNHPRPQLQNCANHGAVHSSGAQYAIGGVAGDFGNRDETNVGHIEQSMNSGTISCADKSVHLGGVAGHLHSGSLTGYSNSIRDCYNTGEITSDQKDDTGGILGYAASYTNTYRTFNSGRVHHGNAIIGTHHSGSLFHHSHNYYVDGTGGGWPSSTKVGKNDVGNKGKYEDFDFTNVWDITSSGPVLRKCPFQ